MENRNMEHFASLDVSVKETAICVVDELGKVCREVKVASHPEDLLRVLKDSAFRFKRIGLEAGPLSQWLFDGLAKKQTSQSCASRRDTQRLS
jgi:transposase